MSWAKQVSNIGLMPLLLENSHAACLLYTSDAADDGGCVDLGGRRIIKKIFLKQKTAYEITQCLVGSEMCIRDSTSREYICHGQSKSPILV